MSNKRTAKATQPARKQRDLNATPEDFSRLLQVNPMAAQQLSNIILERLLNETEDKLAAVVVNDTTDESDDE